MPAWIQTRPPLKDSDELVRSYQLAEVHIIAAHPDIQKAVFPSKFWNSLASGRRLVFSVSQNNAPGTENQPGLVVLATS
jgi:hypothetical protein